MSKNFTSISIKLIILAYFIVTILIIKESYFDSTVIKDISLITSSFCTLIIAILLFDRFDYRKKIFDKKLDIVLSLLEDLKSTSIMLLYVNKPKEIWYAAGSRIIDKKQLNIKHLKETIDFSCCVLIQPSNFAKYLRKIELYKANPFMPKEIVKSLNFISHCPLHAIEDDTKYNSHYIQVSFNDRDNKNYSLDSWYRTADSMTFEILIMGYINCLDNIEKWINIHSNYDADLNL
ncbi:hypothetical protein [Flavobacterium sp.]|uniref:hypothetical protein n=1 Tax=Flavobacterium sp. TaxID=239 RepID=UPI00374DCC85